MQSIYCLKDQMIERIKNDENMGKAAQGLQSWTHVVTHGPESHNSLCKKYIDVFMEYVNTPPRCNVG